MQPWTVDLVQPKEEEAVQVLPRVETEQKVVKLGEEARFVMGPLVVYLEAQEHFQEEVAEVRLQVADQRTVEHYIDMDHSHLLARSTSVTDPVEVEEVAHLSRFC